jgi:transcriptional regulator with XRE-family HTH domain
MADKWTRLIALREERQLSQVEVARALGISRSGFSMYELGQREPDMETVRKLANYFNVTTDYLLGRTDDPSGGADEPISDEWKRVIHECKAMGLEPEQVLRALAGLSLISDVLKTNPEKKDREA